MIPVRRHAARRSSRLILLVLALGWGWCRPAGLAAQAPAAQRSPVLRYGKWVAAALAVGFTAQGIRTHNGADDAYARLITYCMANSCTINVQGRYAEAAAELRYHNVVQGDRRSRAWLVGGQLALVSAVTLFVLELRHGDEGPQNIPYSGFIVEPGAVSRFGVRLPLP